MRRKAQAATTAVRSRGARPAEAATPPADDATSGEPPRTIAEGRRAITEAYDLAGRFLWQTTLVECNRGDLRATRSFAFFPENDDAADLLLRWDRHRERTLGRLRDAFQCLKSLKVETERAFERIRPMLDFAAAELKPFNIGGGTFRHSFGLLWFGFHQTESLYHQAAGIYSQPRIAPLGSRIEMVFESMDRNVMPFETQQFLMNRIPVERSRLARDLPAFLAYVGAEADPATATQTEADEPSADKRLNDLLPAWRNAYLALKYAEHQAEKELTDRDAWDFLDTNGAPGGYRLPLPDTFADYCNRARRRLGESKYTPRGGRAAGARSVVRRSEI